MNAVNGAACSFCSSAYRGGQGRLVGRTGLIRKYESGRKDYPAFIEGYHHLGSPACTGLLQDIPYRANTTLLPFSLLYPPKQGR